METLEMVVLPKEVQDIANLVSTEKREEVNNVLNSIFAGTADWKAQVDAIDVKGIEDVMSIKLADTARLNAKNARLAAEKTFDAKRDEVQAQMQSYQLEDKLWLKAKQTMQLLFKDIEDSAKYKAEYAKRYEAEQRELKILQRINRLQPLNPDIHRSEFENMSDDTFNSFVLGIENAIEVKKEAERIAEEARLAAVKAEQERIEAQRIENERLKKEAEEKEIQLMQGRLGRMDLAMKFLKENGFEQDEHGFNAKNYSHFIGMGHYCQLESDNELNLFKESVLSYKNKIEAERLAKIEADKQAAILAAQQKENARIAAELKAKQDAETKAQKEREAAELKAKQDAEKLAKAPVKKQLQSWVNSFELPASSVDNETSKIIVDKFNAFKSWASTQVDNL